MIKIKIFVLSSRNKNGNHKKWFYTFGSIPHQHAHRLKRHSLLYLLFPLYTKSSYFSLFCKPFSHFLQPQTSNNPFLQFSMFSFDGETVIRLDGIITQVRAGKAVATKTIMAIQRVVCGNKNSIIIRESQTLFSDLSFSFLKISFLSMKFLEATGNGGF